MFVIFRLIAKTKGRRIVMYRGPCGRILRNIKEIHHYLRLVGSKLSVDYFDFDHWVNCTDEFMVDHCLFETPVSNFKLYFLYES